MDEDDEDLGDSPLIHCLPHDVMGDVCNILDSGDLWEEIVGFMPDIIMLDVEGCRKIKSQHSPSQFLLRIWASKGYTILDLYNLFALTKLVRCMILLRDHVDSKYHVLEDDIIQSGIDSAATTKQASVSMKYQQASTSNAGVPKADNLLSTTSASAKPSTTATTGSTSSTFSADPLMSALQNTVSVPYEELVAATNNFSSENVLGKGGYGVVYKGEWQYLNVAVKRINVGNTSSSERGSQANKERLRQSLQELRTLAKYRHDNILPLYAVSLEGPEPCLVYMYMANGSLEDRLLCRRGTAPLTWPQKLGIAEGSARGILYLHSIAKTPIIHGDVKSANILLGKYLEPKLGDFGLSRDGQIEADADEKSPLIASHIKGTLAYLPPEFITSKILSTKLDVYSFGIVLLEVATGLRAHVESRTPHKIVDFVQHALSTAARSGANLQRSMIDGLMDKRTPSTSSPQCDSRGFCDLIRLGLQCANTERSLRPSFKDIASKLERITEVPKVVPP